MIYLLFIGGIGEIGKKVKISAALRRFFIGGKIAFIGGKGQKARFPAAFVALPDSFAFVACVRSIVKPKVSAFLFCQALRRAIGGGLLLPSIYFCQAIAHAHTHAEGGGDHFGYFGQAPYLHAIFNLTNMTETKTIKFHLTFV